MFPLFSNDLPKQFPSTRLVVNFVGSMNPAMAAALERLVGRFETTSREKRRWP